MNEKNVRKKKRQIKTEQKRREYESICFISYSFMSAFRYFTWPSFFSSFSFRATFILYIIIIFILILQDFNSLRFCFDFNMFMMYFLAATVHPFFVRCDQ